MFVASPGAGVVTHLDAATGAVRGTTMVATANSVVATASAVSVGGSSLVRLDPATGAGRRTSRGETVRQTGDGSRHIGHSDGPSGRRISPVLTKP